MGVVMKTIEKFLDAFVNKSVMCDVVSPIRQLGFVGELAVKNEVGGLDVGAFLRHFFDGISAIAQDTLVAVDKSNFARARSCVRECRVVTHQSEIFGIYFHGTQIESANRLVLDGKFVLASGAIVGDAQSVTPSCGGSLIVDNRFGFGRAHSLTLSGRPSE